MAMNMTDSCGSSGDFESFSHFAHQSPQLDFSFLSSHDTLKDHHVPALFNSNLPDDLPSLGLTGDTIMDDTHPTADQTAPRKRIRGERIVWTPEEDEYLRRAVQIYGDKTEKWAKIAACVPGRTNKNCRKRWFHSLDPSLKKGGWTEEEDHLLRTGVENFRGQWSKIAERIQGRTDDQCAKRWRESLDPEIDRAAWTPDDDILLLKKFEEYGTQWQKIALSFPGRPGLHCRNRWRKIQRSLNHMERANKRRRNQFNIKEMQSGTQRSDESSGRSRLPSSDETLLHDAFLDDQYNLLEDSNDQTEDRNDSNPDEERPYGCAIPGCKFESSSPSLLFYHFKASHHGTTVLKPFRCTVPGCEDRKRYKNINGLQYHVTHAKNTLGHSGHGSTQQDSQQQATVSSPETKAEDATPDITAAGDALEPYTASFNRPVSKPLSIVPTPAEIQYLIPPAMSKPLITHQAFNIPHTPESLEEPLVPSPTLSFESLLPRSHSTSLQCPELGCGQIFHVLNGLTAHMANNHGHQHITMKSSDISFGPDSIAIPENGFDDVDMDLGHLESSPTIDTNMLLMDDAEMQAQLQKIASQSFGLGLDVEMPDTTQDLDILSMNELLFANHIANSLNNFSSYSNRIHFGTHINVSANDSLTLPSTPVTSANVSPRMMAINIPADIIAPVMEEQIATTGTVAVKKFPCLSMECSKSYGSNSAMRAHMRHEHPGVHIKPGKAVSASASPPAMELVSAPQSPGTAITATGSTMSKQQKQSSQKRTDDSSEKPFKCLVPGCGKGYTNINGLKNHLLQAHGSTPKKGASA